MNTIRYQTCQGRLKIHAHIYKGEPWHRISSEGHIDRWFRIFKPNALVKLNQKYRFIDGSGCLNENGILEQTKPSHLKYVRVLHSLDEETRMTNGAEQKTKYSGICWYCASLFFMFFSKQMRTLLLSKLDEEDKMHTKNILSNPKNAESFRQHMFYKYNYGDDPKQPDHMDGQNGFSQFCILASKLDIPLIRLYAPSMFELTEDVTDQLEQKCRLRREPRVSETSLLCIRCFRTKWAPLPRYTWKGRRYKLVAMLIGSEHCGHQIGVSTCNMKVGDWAVADSDASKVGVGPIFWSIRRKAGESKQDFLKRWQSMWGSMIPATKFSKGVCDMNPENRDSLILQQMKHIQLNSNEENGVGVVNTDFIYIHIP